MPPRALEPAGVALVDKPQGPSSFAVVAQIRRVTGARTGHAGTLDPFATGLLLLLSGRAKRLSGRCVEIGINYWNQRHSASFVPSAAQTRGPHMLFTFPEPPAPRGWGG